MSIMSSSPDSTSSVAVLPAKFGCQIFATEPYWYQGFYSPYYRKSHLELRRKVRAFVEDELKPRAEEWIASEEGYPWQKIHRRAYDLGIAGLIYPEKYGGTRPKDFDAFHEMILWDEIGRVGGGAILGQLSINSMALPPILKFGSEAMKEHVVRPVVEGKKCVCLAISEPTAGSDVANIKTTATRDGNVFVVNGVKKWITGGDWADFFTTAVKIQSGNGKSRGLSLLLVPRNLPGVRVRKLATQFDTAHNTTMVFFDDVRVPVDHLIGREGEGFKAVVENFNHERFIIACSTCRMARLAYEESVKYAIVRRTFGKRLADHQIIRAKLAEMATRISALYATIEGAAYQYARGIDDSKMGGTCALLKVRASKTFEFCAREASQIFGGSALVREGRGKLVERLYREVRATAIPGGSEEILMDYAMRTAIAKAAKL